MRWMIYGANGYTGRLIANEASRRGMHPVLAGRNEQQVARLAGELGFDHQIFDLDEQTRLRHAITGKKLVLHCAGPFSATCEPMMEACLSEGVHYLDITGEIAVFEAAHRLHERARHADVVLMPGAGFDVVPSDCLAVKLADALPAATHLQLAFEAGGGSSPGTVKTSVETLGNGGLVRRGGSLHKVPLAWKTRTIPFAHAKRTGVTIPWGDVYTAHISTGIPDIEVYISMRPGMISNLRRLRWIQRFLQMGPVQTMMAKWIEKHVNGPAAPARKNSLSQLWGEANTSDGRSVQATMTTPNGYDLTVTASLGAVDFLLKNDMEGGFYTPSLLLGADYASSLPGVEFSFVS
ncbi:MAG: NAD(P)H-binding protein [Xanthomonadales bacterium]|nr:saccharopine dehydrogenase NADP-binding domain-containing protein [Gammaproteobacteria bacterium]MBT8053248.1 saccharopine dehydrogenase NADP-binding domain-containing protein [Gammaproteobacteria bacterium]NND56840.1 NAD(P)H-binding protein [Xanthomonadales bacterium]NNK50288.1 NAD(P)H-binding protein [Xanthomonadales bacterium]